MRGHRVISIENRKDAERFLKEIGSDEMGIKLMIPKAVFRAVKIHDIPSRTANIIKQEMLSKGGEAAVKRDTVGGQGQTDVLLLGTLKQYHMLIDKLKMQPFGLRRLADELYQVLMSMETDQGNEINLSPNNLMELKSKTLVMGILNVTPDSFSDGGRYADSVRAAERICEMVDEGADIIDIGGFSTRPGAAPVEIEEETRRVLSVLKALGGKCPVPISVDTFREPVARAALEQGASVINDEGGLKVDPAMAGLAARAGCPVIIMHSRLGGDYHDLIAEILSDLRESIMIGMEAGIDEKNIIIDPGIGFGKTVDENLMMLKCLNEFRVLGRPILIGASRKSFIGKVLDTPPEDRLEGSLAAAVVGVLRGASIIRAHDVKATRRAVDVANAIVRGQLG
ncbi:MAG: dihydropteroate synthase [Chitinophagales bacterium]